MARQPVRRAVAAPPPPTTRLEALGGSSEADVTPAGEQVDPSDDLQAMMGELAGASSSSISVYRSNKGQQLAYVFKCTPDAFSLDTLRDKYNGGEFRLFITRNGVLWKNKTVYVEPKQTTGGDAPPTQAAELAAVMREGFAKQAEMMAATLRALASAPTPPPPAPLLKGADIPAILTALPALIGMLRPPPAPPAPSLDANKSIDLILKGIELAREVKAEGGGEGEPSMLGILRDLIKSPMLAQAAAAMATQPAPAAPRLPQPAAPRPPQPQVTIPQPPPPPAQPSFASETPPPMMQNMLTQYLGLLCVKAAEGSDPSLYADLVLDSLDADTLQQLLSRPPSAVDALIADHPPVAQHREWFEQLVAIIAEALAPEPDPVAQLAGNETGQDHAADDATPTIPRGASAG